MIPELGNFALMLSLCVAVSLAVIPVAGAYNGNPRWIAFARPAAAAQFSLLALAFACLVQAFIVNDFSVLYVASNSNSALPLYYRIPATWGGHEGSLLLWVLVLAGWTLAVARYSRSLPDEMTARVLGVMGMISVGFLSFMLFTSNPFDRLLPAAVNGQDLNPLLQDFGMIIHPPLLYMGYVGFSVSFAFAIAALLGGKLDASWARWSRPWTTAAWMFLTLGIFMGSFWAYYELGWGGWWFWDPVENASFMPWLVGTALIHSLAVTEKRGSFRNWTVLLAILTFSLSLLGTFIVRSGVLTSVHAFATDPRRGAFILVFLALVIGGSLLLYAWRAQRVEAGGRFGMVSRESALLVNNVLLLVAAATVLLGTLYPLFLDALNLGKISVGPPYFETVFVPLMLPMLLLLAIAPFLQWKQSDLKEVMHKLGLVVASAVAVIALAAFAGLSALSALGLGLAAWITFATVKHAASRVGHSAANESWTAAWIRQPRSYWGMVIAHLGIAVFVAGAVLVRSLEMSSDVVMRAGQDATLGAYGFRFEGVSEVRGPNYLATQGRFIASRDGEDIAMLLPEKRLYMQQQDMPMTEAAIQRGVTRDLYISLGDRVDEQTWVVRLQIKPFIAGVWAGCLLMAFGGLLAVSDRRYRLKARRETTGPAADISVAGQGARG